MKGEEGAYTGSNNFDNQAFEFTLQRERVTKILKNVVYKLKLLSRLQLLVENDGEILRKFLNKTESDYIVFACQEHSPGLKQAMENRSDLTLICNMLERINLNDKKTGYYKKPKTYANTDQFDIHIAYAVDLILRCKPLVAYMESLEGQEDALVSSFIESMEEFLEISTERLRISAREEIESDNQMKLAYRQSEALTKSIQELEEFLEKQRDELTKEHDRKEAILEELTLRLQQLKEKCTTDINKIVYDSEVLMMKEYLKSSERQEELSKEAKESVRKFDSLLEEHLDKEKLLRVKRLKVETQLASWVTKYDTDVGEKQAEYDGLEEKLREVQNEMQELQDKLDEQEDEYFALMKEKEAEEDAIMQEKAWIFLQNRAARRIQGTWRAYRIRKLARKKGRKSKKKEGSAGGKKGKGKKGLEPQQTSTRSSVNPNELLDKKFSKAVLEEIKSKQDFTQELEVDLMQD